jgi:cyclopropane-fatty-acyl-phospholipid synthase
LTLNALVKRRIREGALTARLPWGETIEAGDGSGKPVGLSITSARALARLATNPEVALGEAYMDGDLRFDTGGIWDLADLIGRNTPHIPVRPAGPIGRWWLDRRLQANAREAARRNVAHHYDLSNDFYRRFLDADMQYSCAYFGEPDLSLEAAQLAKKRHIANKLLLGPDLRVLDIGCGWGGLALTLASEWGVRVDGVTLSSEQLALAKQRSENAGLQQRTHFALADYRDLTGPYDRIVSVGMFEHVGRPNYQVFFDQVARLLKDDGVAVIHSIGRFDGPGFPQPWIAKYIFPGGYIPSLSEVLPAVERAGLMVTDIEILRLHYARTLACWRERLERNKAEVVRQFDERFYRMWEFYLCVSEMAFRHRGHMVFQMQLAKRVDRLPLTRDYLYGRGEVEPEQIMQAARQVA